jgi:hypothetical protein
LVLAAVWWFKILLPQRRLLRDGELLPGKVQECRKGNGHQVVLKYRFAAPDGHAMEGKEEARRSDLKDAALPIAGTAVVVFWSARGVYAVL